MNTVQLCLFSVTAVLCSFSNTVDAKCLNDIMVIIDNSGSVEGVFDDEKEIAAHVIEALDVSPTTTRVAYIEYSAQPRKVFGFNDYMDRDSVAAAIHAVQQVGGATNTAAALRMAHEDFNMYARHKVNRIILMVSDGHSLNSIDELTDIMKRLIDEDVTIYMASASSDPDFFEFDIYTDHQPDQVFLENNITAMPEAVARFVKGGGCLPREKISIEVIKPTPEVLTCQIELYLVIDNSESVELVFNKEKDAAIELLQTLDIGPQNIRVGLIQYSDDVQHIFGIDQPQNRDTVIEAVLSIPQIGGNTNTGDALEEAVRGMAAARSEARKIILLISDGHSYNQWDQLQQIVKNVLSQKVSIFVATASDDVGDEEFDLYVDGNYNHLFLKNNLTMLMQGIHKLIPGSGCPPVRRRRNPRKVRFGQNLFY